MATMATNHLWMNLDGRLQRYVKWRYPGLKGYWSTVVRAVAQRPKDDLHKLFPKHALDVRAQCAMEAAAELRPHLAKFSTLKSSTRYASNAHLTLKLYHHILLQTQAEKENREEALRQAVAAGQAVPRKRQASKLRTFSILPTKNAYTMSYIPISTMSFMALLRGLKLEPIIGEGRDQNHRRLWDKYCVLSSVETARRKFDKRILTDGYAVSILMTGLSSPTCALGQAPEGPVPDDALVKGVDPGLTDAVTVADTQGNTWSYSSARCYEKAHYNYSNRRTAKMNQCTEDLASGIPSCDTARLVDQARHVKAYLAALPTLLKHRHESGYRRLRFLRYCRRKVMIKEICDMLAPPGQTVYIGFGNWNGGAQSPISRRTCGPLKEIKFELQRRPGVHVFGVDECKTSQTCHCCRNKLTNMVGDKCVRRRGEDGMTRKVVVRSRIHKVLHCKNSEKQGHAVACCGTTWNRDVNAAKNILMLALLQLQGLPRPAEFQKISTTRHSKDEGASRSSKHPAATCVALHKEGYRTPL